MTVAVTIQRNEVAVTPTATGVDVTVAPVQTSVVISGGIGPQGPQGNPGPSLTIKELDGTPSIANVSELRVSNGTLTDFGSGVASLTTGGGGGGGASALDDLTDVTLSAPASNQLLKYNGSVWINATNAPAWANVSGTPTTLSSYGITDAASDSELAAHEADTTNIHGIANTANLVLTSDSRLSDSRSPTLHASTHATAGSDPVSPGSIGAATASALSTHIGDTNNPHAVTLAQVGGAPVGAKYIVQVADSTLTNEQALGALATGLLKNTTTTGVLSVAIGDTDYTLPATFNAHTARTDNPHVVTIGQVSPLTTRGDLLTRDASAHKRLALGAVGTFLNSDGTDALWRGLVAGDIPNLSATILTSGTVNTARLGSGTADATTFLRGDNTWAIPSGGGGGVSGSGTANQLAFWDSGSSIAGDSALTFNAGSHRLSLQPSSGYGEIRLGGATGGFPLLSFYGGSSEEWELYRSSDGLAVWDSAAGQNRLNIRASGNVLINEGLPQYRVGIGISSPAAALHIVTRDAVTSVPSNVMLFEHKSTGTPVTGFGSATAFQLQSSTTSGQYAAEMDVVWADATDATRRGQFLFYCYDATTFREVMRLESTGTAPAFGALGAPASARITLPAAATDAATTQTLANALRSALITFGFCN